MTCSVIRLNVKQVYRIRDELGGLFDKSFLVTLIENKTTTRNGKSRILVYFYDQLVVAL